MNYPQLNLTEFAGPQAVMTTNHGAITLRYSRKLRRKPSRTS